MKDQTQALRQELEQAKGDLRTVSLALSAANREIESLKERIKVLTASVPVDAPTVEAPRRGRPPKAQ